MTRHTPSIPTISAFKPAPLPFPVPFLLVPLVEFEPVPSPPEIRADELAVAAGPAPPTCSVPLGVTPPKLPRLLVWLLLADVAFAPLVDRELPLVDVPVLVPVGLAPMTDGVQVV